MKIGLKTQVKVVIMMICVMQLKEINKRQALKEAN